MSKINRYFSFQHNIVAGLALFLLSTVLLLSGWILYKTWGISPQEKVIANTELKLIHGEGKQKNQKLKVTKQSESGRILISTGRIKLPAKQLSVLQYQIDNQNPLTDTYFFWRNLSQNKKINSQYLITSKANNYINLSKHPEWSGHIGEFGFIIYGNIEQAIEINALSFHSFSPMILINTLFAEWSEFRRWTQKSINFTYLVSPKPLLYPVVAASTIFIFGLLIHLFYSWVAARSFQPVAIALLFVLSWFSVDIIWLKNRVLQSQETYVSYAGKSSDEKLLASDHAELVQFATAIKQLRQKNGKGRIFFLTSRESRFLGLRLRYFLLPINTAYPVNRIPLHALTQDDWIIAPTTPDKLKYDEQSQMLKWKKQRAIRATELLKTDIGSVYQFIDF